MKNILLVLGLIAGSIGYGQSDDYEKIVQLYEEEFKVYIKNNVYPYESSDTSKAISNKIAKRAAREVKFKEEIATLMSRISKDQIKDKIEIQRIINERVQSQFPELKSDFFDLISKKI